jgi:hypothetical protein
MHLSTLIEDSYGYKIERYKDTVGRNGRKKNNSVIRITDLSIVEPNVQKNDDVDGDGNNKDTTVKEGTSNT